MIKNKKSSKETDITDKSTLLVKEAIFYLSGFLDQKKFVFNSKEHVFELIGIYTGYSRTKIVSRFKELEDKGYVRYDEKKNQIILPKGYTERDDFDRVPSYILQTHALKDRSHWLDDTDYRILVWIHDNIKYIITHVYEREFDEDYKEQFYFKSSTIAERLGYTVHQVRLSLRKLRLYFGDYFWARPTSDEKAQRKHRHSMTNTFKIPARKEWKRIILSKVQELDPDAYYEYEMPCMVTVNGNKIRLRYNKNLKKKGQKEVSVKTFSKLCSDKKFRDKMLQLGQDLWKEKKKDYSLHVSACMTDSPRIRSYMYREAVNILDELREEGRINDVSFDRICMFMSDFATDEERVLRFLEIIAEKDVGTVEELILQRNFRFN